MEKKQELQLEQKKGSKQDAKEIDLTSIIEQQEEQDEIGVEYYTDAPAAEETNISRGM